MIMDLEFKVSKLHSSNMDNFIIANETTKNNIQFTKK